MASNINIPGGAQIPPPSFTSGDFPTMLGQLFKWLVIMAGVLAVVFIVLAAFQYMITSNFTQKIDLRKRIFQILTGLALALSTYLILFTINPALLEVSFGRFGAGSKVGTNRDPALSRDSDPLTDRAQAQVDDEGYVVDQSGKRVLDNKGNPMKWGDDRAGEMQGKTINGRFTYYSSTEAVNDSNTIAGKNAVGGQLVAGTDDPRVVGSAASNYYPRGTIISTQRGNNKYYYVIDDNNIGASNNNLNNNHTFDIYNNQSNPSKGKPDNGNVTIEFVPSGKLSNSQVQNLHNYNTLSSYLNK